jgi:hypothetical protein
VKLGAWARRLLMVSIKSIKPGKRFLGSLIRPPARPKQIVSVPWRWLRSFLISFERPKIGSPSWKLRFACIRRKPTARSSGYIEFTPRLRTDFYGKTPAIVDHLNAGREPMPRGLEPCMPVCVHNDGGKPRAAYAQAR